MASFAASINCIDGRVQGPLSEWIRKEAGVDHVDTITEPGCDLLLSREEGGPARAKLEISVRAHGTKEVFVSGHHDCAANPVSREEHEQHIAAAVSRVESWGLPVRVRGLWVDDSWQVRPL